MSEGKAGGLRAEDLAAFLRAKGARDVVVDGQMVSATVHVERFHFLVPELAPDIGVISDVSLRYGGEWTPRPSFEAAWDEAVGQGMPF